MKYPLARPLFPALEITPADEKSFALLVDEFIDKLIVDEHTFRITQSSIVDTTKWKFLRKAESINVYREDYGNDHVSQRMIPPFLVVGKTPGSLDDFLYGFTTPSRESELIKSSYVDDNVADIEVLRMIRRPTLKEPFSHLSVKWFVCAPHASIISPRDYVYIDTIGTRVLPGGERIGYRFSHSIKLRGADPLPDHGFIRGNLSISGLFRETRNNEVEIYGRAFFQPGGTIPRNVFSFVVCMQVASVAAQMHNGQLKKLALALRRTDARTWTVAVPPPKYASDSNECGVCTKQLNLLNKSRSQCVLCARKLCHACRVRKLLSFVKDDFSVQRLRVTFCNCCVQQAISVPSAFAATEEFLTGQDDFYRPPESFHAAAVATSVWRSFLSV